MKPERRPVPIILLLCSLLPAFFAAAQEQSVRPGINRHFEDPDWQRWVSTFERPGREVYDQRHAIVTASKVHPGGSDSCNRPGFQHSNGLTRRPCHLGGGARSR